MLANYLKIALRNISRHKGYAAINILGLALGMTCCLFILLWVRDERSVDHFHAQGQNIYSVYKTVTADGKTDGSYTTPLRVVQGQPAQFPLDGVTGAIPGIVHTAYYTTGYELPWGHAETFQVGDKIVKLEGARAGADFFRMFSYPLIEGNPATALNNVTGISVSRRMANLFWGSPAAAMGKTIRYENQRDFTVTSVFEDIPLHSTQRFEYLFSWEAHKTILSWASNDYQSYVQLAPGTDVASVTAKLNRFLKTRWQGDLGTGVRLGLQPFSDRYLRGTFVNGRPTGGRIEYIRLFTGVAFFILLLACINFMNLATARSVRRAKEVGLRKVVGSTRGYLIGQFFGESLVFALLAMLLSIGLLQILLPAFNRFTDKHIAFPFGDASFWALLASIGIVTGLVAGSYPALYLSSLKPVRVLKGVFQFTQGAIWCRKSLTVFQFVLSIVLLIATIVIVRQTDYVENANVGYDRSNLVYTRVEGSLKDYDKYVLFKHAALQLPGVVLVDRSSETPHTMNFIADPDAINWEGKSKGERVGFNPASVGFDFVRLMNLSIVQGRDFSLAHPTDSTDAFLVNETAVRAMGMKDPLGKWVSAWSKRGHIIGVLKDYHTHSLRDPILPLMIDVKEDEYFGVVMVRIRQGQTRETLAGLEKIYKDINPGYAFAWQFVDEEYKQLYSSERLISRLSVLFATLAILISCLGLLGLVMFSAEQRTREIGIRKTLGASMTQIVTLFSKDSLQLILVAFLIAGPLGWYAMHTWLQGFAYRIPLSWWIFALSGAATLALTLATVGYQAVKAAAANPVQSLRTD